MLTLNEIKVGKKIVLNEDPFLVTESQHSKMGRAGAVLRTKLRNLKTGAIIDKTFQGADKVEEAEIEQKEAQFLYNTDDSFSFMDLQSYEQFDLPAKVIGEKASYLKEGSPVNMLFFKNEPINIELPIKMVFEVVEAPPSIKGNTADGGSKQVTLETGIKVSVPLFIKKGDKIKINTETGLYAGRV